MSITAWLVFVVAALLEVGGDGVIRSGLKTHRLLVIVVGCLLLGIYGLVVNIVQWDFSRLLGVYVSVFALISILFGWLIFKETITPAVWGGLALIMAGGMVIQFAR